MPLLGRDVYQFRSAVCECIGVVCGGKIEEEEEEEVVEDEEPQEEEEVRR